MKKHLGMKNKLFITAVLLLTFKIGLGQTNVGGGIFSNTTWTQSGSPYIVTSNLVVMTGVVLTIQPGVVVKFNNSTNMEVRGDLQAIGASNDTIVFTSSSPSPTQGIWNGIAFWNDLTLKYIKISFATTSLTNTNSKVINIKHSRFYNNNVGLSFIGSSTSNLGYIDSSQFDNNSTAISSINHANYISNSSFINNDIGFGYVFNALISNCTFTGHTTKAIDGFAANYIGNVFTNNNIALRIKLFALSQYQIKDNIITNNQTGVQARGDASSTPNTGFFNNTICNNSTFNVENTDNISLYMQNNCWCTNDSLAISNSIHDAYDNIALGLVNYSPFQTTCSLTNVVINSPEANEISTYPNPFSQETTIYASKNLKGAILTIYNSLGQQVNQIRNISGQRVLLNRDNLQSGIYFFQLTQNGEVYKVDKLVIADN